MNAILCSLSTISTLNSTKRALCGDDFLFPLGKTLLAGCHRCSREENSRERDEESSEHARKDENTGNGFVKDCKIVELHVLFLYLFFNI